MGGESKWFENIIKAGSVESVKFNLDLNIPDLNGRNIQVLFLLFRFMIKKWIVSIKVPGPCLVIFIKSLKGLRDNLFLSLFLFLKAWSRC